MQAATGVVQVCADSLRNLTLVRSAGPAIVKQILLRNFSKKVDFLGVPESKLEFG